CRSRRVVRSALLPRSRSTTPVSLNDTATPELYTLSLHDALPIYDVPQVRRAKDLGQLVTDRRVLFPSGRVARRVVSIQPEQDRRSEEHTSELQSPYDLVCRLLLEKKKRAPRAARVVRVAAAAEAT